MPKISADSIADHVAHQRQAIFEAATELFIERGVAAVSLGDIASAVGLKRNSLYRYFNDRDHLIVELVEHQMAAHADEVEALLATEDSERARLHRWVDCQLDAAADRSHMLGYEIAASPGVLGAEARTRIGELHASSVRSVTALLSEVLGGPPAEQLGWTLDLLRGILSGATTTIARNGDSPGARALAHRTVDYLLDGGSEPGGVEIAGDR
jgi:AcrR family transcriptional regulator